MKRYRACTIKIIEPKQLSTITGFNSKEAAYAHRIINWNKLSNNKAGTTKKQLGKGTFKAVYAIEGEPPETFTSLDTDYVLAKLKYEEKNHPGEKGPKKFIISTLTDVLAQMLVTGQKENTVYFSNLRKTDDAPDNKSYRYCLYMPKLKGTEWDLERNEIKNNIQFLDQLFYQLKAFHLRGFYHADVKYANSMIDGTETATLIDFGGLRRIWQEETVSSPLFNAFNWQNFFWKMLESQKETLLRGNVFNVKQVGKIIGEAQKKFESAGQWVTSTSKFNAKQTNTLISCYGIHFDMGSIVMLLVLIFQDSMDAKTNKTIKHNQTLWVNCIQDCFKPKSVATLIADYITQLSIKSTDYKPFENFITSAKTVNIEWANIYGINIDELSHTIVDKEFQRRQQEKSNVQNEKESIEKKILNLTAEANQEGKKTKIDGNLLYHIFDTVGIETDPELKNRALFTIRSAFLTSENQSQLKELLERFFYIALINRNSNFLWRTREYTTTFKKLVEIIAPTLQPADAFGSNISKVQNEKILNTSIPINIDGIDATIQVKDIQPLIIKILNYEDLPRGRPITADSLYNALKKHKDSQYDWIFDYKKHTGNADQILDCINNTFNCTDGDGKPIEHISFNTFNRTNKFKSKFFNPASTTKKSLIVTESQYVNDTSKTMSELCQSLNLNLTDNDSTHISTYVENLYNR